MMKTKKERKMTDEAYEVFDFDVITKNLPEDTDPELIQDIVESLKEAATCEFHLRETEAAIEACVPTDLLEEQRIWKERKKRAQSPVHAALWDLFPQGGAKLEVGPYRVTFKKSEKALTVNPEALTKEAIDALIELDLNGRPAVIYSLDTQVLDELARRDQVDLKPYLDAGIVEYKQRRPSMVFSVRSNHPNPNRRVRRKKS